MKKRPLILVTNDDGITAPGLRTLVKVMNKIGEVVVVAPDSPQSGMGHAITVDDTLYCKKEKISEYIEKEVDNGNIGQSSMKECIAHLFRLLEQKKLNKKGNIEYDSDNGKITSISKSLFDGVV